MNKRILYLGIFSMIFLIVLFIIFNYGIDSTVTEEKTEEEILEQLEHKLQDTNIYLKEEPEDLEALEEALGINYTLGNYHDAEVIGLQLIEKDPTNHLHYHTMGNLKTSMKEWDEAIEFREKAHELEQSSHTLYYLSLNYLVVDIDYSLELMNGLESFNLESEEPFLKNYRKTLEELSNNMSYEGLNDLVEFVYSDELMIKIIENQISLLDDDLEITKLNNLIEEIINRYN